MWHTAPTTFRTKRDAQDYLAATRADVSRGHWIDPRAGRITLADYASAWLDQRVNLRPRTKELYAGILRRHIFPTLGHIEIGKIAPVRVRSWHASLAAADRPGSSTVAKSYRLLHTILQTAVCDELIPRNPCALKGASVEHPAERPIATIAQVYELADGIEPRYRALVLMATFTGLRLGELRALRKNRLDLVHRSVHVVEQYQQLANGTLVAGPPKTEAGRRVVSIPEAILPDLEAHLIHHSARSADGLVFAGADDRPFRLASFYKSWRRATQLANLDGFHFHDLRHTGNTLAAATGASTKELMSRMGHASPRAALIYQHATQDRDVVIATALSMVIDKSRTADPDKQRYPAQ